VTKEEAKLKVNALVMKLSSLDEHKIKVLNEAATKQGYIQPLFESIGWDFTNTDEVSPEDNTSNGRVDYAFKLHGVSQFYVEAKSLKEDVNDPKYIKQAISYAYNKGVTWAILTNFHSLRVFNAQKTEPFLSLDYKSFDINFEKLWLLSRDSLATGLLNQEAVDWGALPTPIPVEKRLFAQMRIWREQLFNQIFRYNEKLGLKPEQVDDFIQKLFNRLIFIRTAEDRGIEEKGLLALLHQWKPAGSKGDLLDALRLLFKEYDGYYDSELFDQKLHHVLDNSEIFIENEVIENILVGLYDIPGSMANYNFNDIDADVLGAVYEQYLGHVAEVMKQRAKEAQIKMELGVGVPSYSLNAKKERRKEHGIYYTPKFITDYIVRETIGRYLLENAGLPDKLHNIKILDPACGSGSFLIRAYDELLKYYARELKKPVDKLDQSERLPILTNSIFGVDLDKQAIEITRLNLLLRSLAHREPLPFLGNNIKQGNSLVSGTDAELEQCFGADWQNQHPFDWQDEFSGVMAKGGFDVVIGNPPYIRQEQLSVFKPLWQKSFECYDGAADIYVYFFERGLQLLKEGGYLAYISPNKYFRSGYGKRLREYLSAKTTIEQIIDFGDAPVFDAVTYPSIIVLRKILSDKNKTRIFTWNPNEPIEKFSAVVSSSGSTISQKELTANGWHLESSGNLNLLEKLSKAGKPLGEYVGDKFYRGVTTGFNEAFVVDRAVRDRLIMEDPTSSELFKPLLRGRDIKRWTCNFGEQYLLFIPWHFPLHNDSNIIGASELAEKAFQQNYPAIYNYLLTFKTKLAARNKDETGIRYEWYALQRCAATYWQEFAKPKIILGRFMNKATFAFDKNGYFHNDALYMITGANEYVVGVLNSSVSWWFLSQICTDLQNGYLHLEKIFFKYQFLLIRIREKLGIW
jgi:type I restriction-modification system DNA methylase subunit